MISTSYIGVLEKNIIQYVLGELHYATKEEEERRGVNFVLFKVIDHGCLKPLSTIFYVYCGIFDWLKKPKYLQLGENHWPTTSHWQTWSYVKVHLNMSLNQSHNFIGDSDRDKTLAFLLQLHAGLHQLNFYVDQQLLLES